MGLVALSLKRHKNNVQKSKKLDHNETKEFYCPFFLRGYMCIKDIKYNLLSTTWLKTAGGDSEHFAVVIRFATRSALTLFLFNLMMDEIYVIFKVRCHGICYL